MLLQTNLIPWGCIIKHKWKQHFTLLHLYNPEKYEKINLVLKKNPKGSSLHMTNSKTSGCMPGKFIRLHCQWCTLRVMKVSTAAHNCLSDGVLSNWAFFRTKMKGLMPKTSASAALHKSKNGGLTLET